MRTPTPLNGFVEITSGNIRLGPRALAYDDPYERFVSFVVADGRTAVLKGWTGSVSHHHRRKIQQLLKPLGLVIDWDRSPKRLTPRKKSRRLRA